jgi:23S rRNA (cytosine1962-C5)-methyltransferase
MTTPARLVLAERRAKPFFFRHPWVFSGAVKRLEGEAQKGDVVSVHDARGVFVAHGFYNPDSQIVARLLSWDQQEPIDDDFWRRRLREALRLRDEVLRLPDRASACRLVYAESDGMPGLVVDRYDQHLVCQIHSAGFARRRETLAQLLQETVHPRGILESSDADVLEKECLPPARGLLAGEAPPARLPIHENQLRLVVDLEHGQKTGWFLDQRDNRLAAAAYAAGRRVLDVYSYTGGFALAALVLGHAADALCVDRSEGALAMARENAALNGVALRTQTGDAAETMRRLKAQEERFGMVVLDPPKFAQSRAGLARAMHGYHVANLLGIQLLEPGGILVTCSCSQYVSEADFMDTVNQAAIEASRQLQVLERRGQAPDHPVIASCPETGYLKCLICRAS